MATKLIRLADGTLVEVEVPSGYIEQISGDTATKVSTTIDSTLVPVLIKDLEPIKSAWKELNKDMTIEKAEIEVAFGFEIEGNLFVAKSKHNASLSVTSRNSGSSSHLVSLPRTTMSACGISPARQSKSSRKWRMVDADVPSG